MLGLLFFGLRRAYFSGASLFNVGTSCGFAAVTGTSCSISNHLIRKSQGIIEASSFLYYEKLTPVHCFALNPPWLNHQALRLLQSPTQPRGSGKRPRLRRTDF